MATSSASGRGSSNRERGAKAIVADQISQAVQSTSNLFHLMQHSSPSQACSSGPANDASQEASGNNSNNREYWARLGGDALGNFISGCTRGDLERLLIDVSCELSSTMPKTSTGKSTSCSAIISIFRC